MKGGIAAHVIRNIQCATKPPKRNEFKVRNAYGQVVTMSGNGKEGQTFDEKRIADLCQRLGFDPCEVAVRGLDPSLDLKDKDRIDIALRLMEYLMPKKRAIEGEVELEHKYVVAANPLSENEWQRTYGMGPAEGAAEGAD